MSTIEANKILYDINVDNPTTVNLYPVTITSTKVAYSIGYVKRAFIGSTFKMYSDEAGTKLLTRNKDYTLLQDDYDIEYSKSKGVSIYSSFKGVTALGAVYVSCDVVASYNSAQTLNDHESRLGDHDIAIAAEILRAEAAEGAEADTRASAVTLLRTDLNGEISARQSAISALNTKSLADAPQSYTADDAGKVLAVKADGSGYELASVSAAAGVGDVSYSGSSAVVGHIPTFDTTTGKSIADSGIDPLTSLIPATGWIPADETWTYASADSPTFKMTIPGDKTGKYSKGMKIRITQDSVIKHFIITADPVYSSPNTTITMYGGTDYTLTNTAITNPFFSLVQQPYGFNRNPDKWSVTVTSVTEMSIVSPTGGARYNPGSVNISCPIGDWFTALSCFIYSRTTTPNTSAVATLSETSNALSTNNLYMPHVVSAGSTGAQGAGCTSIGTVHMSAKTTLYFIVYAIDLGISSIILYNEYSPLVIKLTIADL